MRDAVIVAATRTPIGRFQGTLSQVPAAELGATVIRALLAATGVDAGAVDEVVMGHVLAAGAGQNTARQAAIRAGLPDAVPAFTVNKVCGSGLKAVQLAAQSIMLGDAEIVVAGGMESMSLAPHVVVGMRGGLRLGHGAVIDTMIADGLWDAFGQYHMGITAENLARRHGITREQQDEYAALSQRRAAEAIAAGRFESQITPVRVLGRDGEPTACARDEQPRAGTSTATLAKLRPAFDEHGTVTAGNSSTLNDGAAAVLLTSAEGALRLKLPVMARLSAYASVGVDPAFMGEGPIGATRRCLKRAGWDGSDVDLIEANEAFAVQVLTVVKALELDVDKVNVNGGAIALGHPIGASGCRVLVTLLHEMMRTGAARGLATLCIGGGQGIALAVERA
ncbi:MAG TPA: acetyl-CoA C-acetyltransferase [Gammaproteobacteria bacterium]